MGSADRTGLGLAGRFTLLLDATGR
ncbi:hypothetical protein BOSEA1005_30036 [Hyphomicrobiales bacterium]|nr:hypothetical protein BOSEA1005_30036 [Hyphomicrobiales bacterium]CAI0346368.1 hypothetical protein BO1005MUT1_510009 [Hyphomicrobiales bacterium]